MKTTILFRPSEMSSVMPNAKGKSNREKYDEMVSILDEKQQEWIELKNKETKKAATLQERILKLQNQIQVAEKLKDLPHLSEGTKTHLRKKMIEIRYQRYKDIENKFLTKGKDCEEESITAYSLIKGRVFENNKIRVKNEYYSGEIDLPWYNKERIMEAITDIKSSYDVYTFFDNENGIKPANKWQGIAYMDLHPTVQKYHIANVLVNNTHDAILLDLHRESYKWKDGDTPAWRELQILKNHLYTKDSLEEFIHLRGCAPIDEEAKKVYNSFVEIPLKERLIEHTFNRDENEIQEARTRIEACRLYIELIYGIKHTA